MSVITKAQAGRANAALRLSLKALERCRELLIIADIDADDLAEYDAATEGVRLNIEEWIIATGLREAFADAPPRMTPQVDR